MQVELEEQDVIDLGSSLQQGRQDAEWKKSILGLVKTFPEFNDYEWGGDKEGWGFVFELIKDLHKRANT